MERVITLRDAWERYDLHPYLAVALIRASRMWAVRYGGLVLVRDEDAREWGEKLDVKRFEHLRGKPIKAYHVEKKYGIPHHTLTGWARSGKITTVGNHHWNVMVDEAEAAFAAHFLKLLDVGPRGKRLLPKPNIGIVFDGRNEKDVAPVLRRSKQLLNGYKLEVCASPDDAGPFVELCREAVQQAVESGTVRAYRFGDRILVPMEFLKRLVKQSYDGWFADLDGHVIHLSEAARKYELSLGTIFVWLRDGQIKQIGTQKNRVLLCEREIAQAAIWAWLFSSKSYKVA
ncbi:MAG: hypothetical protein DRI61_13240 [Chloroflexi bacterium]|nr:MAG: hypothetical protein DRI61_13240 [Chloroflexota bacterium]